MKISTDEFRAISMILDQGAAIFGKSGSSTEKPQISEDMRFLQDVIVGNGDGSATITKESRSTYDAINRMVGTFGLQKELQRLVSRFDRRSGDVWNIRRFKTIYQNSPTLKALDKKFFSSPQLLIEELARLWPEITRELSEARNAGTPVSYSLSSLVCALVAGGRIKKENLQSFQRWASARDLYDRSALLWDMEISEGEKPETLMEKLEILRPRLVFEQQLIRGIDQEKLGGYALTTLVHALAAGGKIPYDRTQFYFRYAHVYELFNRSPTLQRIAGDNLSTDEEIISALVALRPRIIEEQRALRGLSENEPINYSLVTLAYAVAVGKGIHRKSYHLTRTAGERALYDQSAILQSISEEDLETPQTLVKKLVRLRPSIEKEQGKVHYALSTLVAVLAAGGRIEKSNQDYERYAAAYDLYQRSRILQGIRGRDLKDPELLVRKLSELRPQIVIESEAEDYSLSTLVVALAAVDKIKGDIQPYMRAASSLDLYIRSPILQNIEKSVLEDPFKLIDTLASLRPPGYALSTLVQALAAGDAIKGKSQSLERLASARDLYDRSPALQSIESEFFSDPIKLLTRLVELRPKIIHEQRVRREIPAETPLNYALPTLVRALYAGGRIGDRVYDYERMATARDIYERSPTLKNISPDILNDQAKLMEYLLTFRDRIAVENLKASGKLDPAAFIFPEAASHYSLSTLVHALHAGAVIDEAQYRVLNARVAAPLEYFLQRRDAIESEVRKNQDFASVDKSLFTWIKNPNKPVSNGYIRSVIRWGRWHLNNPDISMRSIYDAQELAAMVFSNYKYLFERVPKSVADRLLAAGKNSSDHPVEARRDAVKALQDLLNCYDKLRKEGAIFSESVEKDLQEIRRLVEWNKDALEAGNWPQGGSTPVPYGSPGTSPPTSTTPAPTGGTGASASAQVVITGMSDAGETRGAYAPPTDPVIVPNLLSGMLGITAPMFGAQTALFGLAMNIEIPMGAMPFSPVLL